MTRIWINDGNRHDNAESGYGQASRTIAAGLSALGNEVSFAPFDGMEVCLFVCPPSSVRSRPELPTAAYTLHELPTLAPGKEDWPDILNGLELVISATEWNSEIWRNLGVTVPVATVPLGIDPEDYHPVTGRRCRFLSVHENLGGSSSRENWLDTMRAYLATFDAGDDVELVVKTWKWKPDGWNEARDQLLEELGKPSAAAPATTVISERLAHEDMRALFQSAWVFIKNANREGWSLPCTEAVACGKRVIATRIEPLLSNLPDDTTWIEPGDAGGLGTIMGAEYAGFQAFRARSERYLDIEVGRAMAPLLAELASRSPA